MHIDHRHDQRGARPNDSAGRRAIPPGACVSPNTILLARRIVTSALVVVLVLGLMMRPSAIAGTSVYCSRSADCAPCDLMPGECTHATACLKLMPTADIATIFHGPGEALWMAATHHKLAGVEVPPEQPPPIAVRDATCPPSV